MRLVSFLLIFISFQFVWSAETPRRTESALFIIPNASWASFEATGRYADEIWGKSLFSSKLLAYSDKPVAKLQSLINVPATVDPIAFLNQEIKTLIQDDATSNTLFFMTHAWRDTLNPEKPGIKDVRMYVQKGRGIYFSNLSRQIQKSKPKEKLLRYYASLCYGNGAHVIAFENKNACGLGFGDFEIFFPSGWKTDQDKKSYLPEDWLNSSREANHVPLIQNIATGKSFDMDGSGTVNLLDQYLLLMNRSNGYFMHADQPESSTRKLLPWTTALSSLTYAQNILGKKNYYTAFDYTHSKNQMGLLKRISDLRSHIEDLKGMDEPTLIRWSQIHHSIVFLFDYENDPDVRMAVQALPRNFKAGYSALLAAANPSIEHAKNQFKEEFTKVSNSSQLVTHLIHRFSACTRGEEVCDLKTQLEIIQIVLKDIEKDLGYILNQHVFFQNRGRILDRFLLLGYALQKASPTQREKLFELMDCELKPL